MSPLQATYVVTLDGVEIGRIDKIEWVDYRFSRTRVQIKSAPKVGWRESVSAQDVHDRRWQAVVELLVHSGGVDRDEARSVAQSSRVTVRRVNQ